MAIRKSGNIKAMLDDENTKGMSAQLKRQVKKKIRGATRSKPQKGSGWMFRLGEGAGMTVFCTYVASTICSYDCTCKSCKI